MAKDPAFLFYSSDFLTGVIDMTMEERGQYITLMCLQHQKGHLSEETIRFCVGNASVKVLSKFRLDDMNLYYNERLEEETAKRDNFVQSRQKNGKKGGRPTKNKTDRLIVGKAKNNLPENENENDNEDENRDINDSEIENEEAFEEGKEDVLSDFDLFWAAYPKKKAKADAKKAFAKIKKRDVPKLIPAVEAQMKTADWKKDGGQFIPYPATWLNRGEWENEVKDAELETSNPFLKLLYAGGAKHDTG